MVEFNINGVNVENSPKLPWYQMPGPRTGTGLIFRGYCKPISALLFNLDAGNRDSFSVRVSPLSETSWASVLAILQLYSWCVDVPYGNRKQPQATRQPAHAVR
jgi:hypothetical protein